jgi:hypothetical protein
MATITAFLTKNKEPGTRYFLVIAFILLLANVRALAMDNDALMDFVYVVDEPYIVRLETGEILTGTIAEIAEDAEGAFVRINSVIGRARIYAKEIAWISHVNEWYRHRHRGFLLPTAQPIRNDHFIGLVEGVLPYMGFGIGEWFSMTGGRSLVPGIPWTDQLSVINTKFTLYSAPNGLIDEGEQYYALGFNAGWLNDVNFMGHVFGVATFTGKRTQVSTMLFVKVAGEDIYSLNMGDFASSIPFVLTNGTFGVAIGLDTRFPEMRNLHVVAELWNADLTRPSNTALYLGLRLHSTAVAMDTGLTLVPGPALIPTVAFAWTPF